MARGFWGGEGRKWVHGGVAGGPGGAGQVPRAPDDAEYFLGAAHPELVDGRIPEDTNSIEWDLTTPNRFKARKKPTSSALTPGTLVASDWSAIADGGTFTLLAGQTFTLSNPTGLLNSKKVTYRIKQDGTGGRLIALGSSFRLGTDITSVVLSTTPNAVDYLVCYYDTVDAKIDVVALVKGY